MSPMIANFLIAAISTIVGVVFYIFMRKFNKNEFNKLQEENEEIRKRRQYKKVQQLHDVNG